MTRERVVIDTKVLISGLFSTTSKPALSVEKAIPNGQLVATSETLRELLETLLVPKFDRYVSRERREALLQRLAPSSRSSRFCSMFAHCAMWRMTGSSKRPSTLARTFS